MGNLQTETKKAIKSDKYQTRVLIGTALIILGVIFIIIALNQPKVSNDGVDSSVNSSVSDNAAGSSDKTTVTESNSTTDKTAVEDLMAIDNVGETRANAIIAYREYLGGYTSVEQLKNISGVGDSVYALIEPYVTV